MPKDRLEHYRSIIRTVLAEHLIEQGIPEEVLVPAFCYPPTREAIALHE